MWAEEERTGLLLGGPATPTPTMLAEATVVPRAVLDLGLGVDVQEGALLVAAFPCRESPTRIHLGQLGESWTQTASAFLKAGACCVAEGQVLLVSLLAWRVLSPRAVSWSLSLLTYTWTVFVTCTWCFPLTCPCCLEGQ